MKKLYVLVVMAGVFFAMSVAATAQVKKGKTRPLTTKQLMGALVKPHCSDLGAALKNAPTDDKGWNELATKAALLNEASYILMADGRCPDKIWADAAKSLGEGTIAILEKIEAKDAAGAQEAFKTVSSSCAACHKEHKK